MTAAHRYATCVDLGLPANVVGEIYARGVHTYPRCTPAYFYESSSLEADRDSLLVENLAGAGGCEILDDPASQVGAKILGFDLPEYRQEIIPAFPKSLLFEVSLGCGCDFYPGTGVFSSPTQADTLRCHRLGPMVAHRSGRLHPGDLCQPGVRSAAPWYLGRPGPSGHWPFRHLEPRPLRSVGRLRKRYSYKYFSAYTYACT